MDTTCGLYLASRFNAALASPDPATALNPFAGRDYLQPRAVLDPLTTQAWFGGTADLLTFDAHVAGNLFRLPTGPVKGAAFVEQRRERFSSVSDAASRAGDILGTGQLGADAHLSREAWAVAAEAAVPLLSSRPGDTRGPRLAFEAAARVEEFSGSFNSGIKPSMGLVGRPTRDLLMRAVSRARFALRLCPSFLLRSATPSTTPCLIRAGPLRSQEKTTTAQTSPRLVRQGGNPRLAPETGRALQTGAVWTPRAISQLTFEATWFRFDFEDLISGVSPVYVLENELYWS